MNIIRKSVPIALGLALVCAGRAQEAPRITYSKPAAPVAAILADLSKQTGTAMEANASVAGDAVMISVKDVSLEDLMKRLAGVLHAEWVRSTNGRLTLTRAQGTDANDKRIELAEKVEAVQKTIAKYLGTVRSQPKFDADTAQKVAQESRDQMNKMMERATVSGGAVAVNSAGMAQPIKTPAGRVIANVLGLLTPAQIAALVSGNRVVFSTNPTRMQYGLGANAVSAFQQFVNEQRLYAEAQKQGEPADAGQRFIVTGNGDSSLGEGDIRAGMGPALLIVDPAPFGRAINVHVLVSDRNGGTLARGSLMLPYELTKSETKPFKFEGEKPIQLSGLSMEFAKAIQSASGSGGSAMVRMVFRTGNNTVSFGGDPMARPPIAISKELREMILNPEKYEPLSMAPSEGFGAVASNWGKNFIAYLPDSVLVPLTNQLSANSIVPSQLLASAQSGLDLQVSTEGDWMSVSPRRPAAARTRHIERAALGKYLRILDAKGYSALDDLANFALAQPKQIMSGDFDYTYLRLINTSAADQSMSKFSFPGAWGMLRFYATLAPGQRQTLGNGGSVPLANLSTLQMDLLTDQVFNSFDGPTVGDPQRTPSDMERAMMFLSPPYATERTVALPNGLMRNGSLTVRTSNDPAVQAIDSKSGSAGLMTAGSLAWAKLQAEKPGALGGLASSAPAPDKYRMASQNSYTFLFTLAPNVALIRSLEDASVDRNAPLVAYDGLPADFRRQVDAALADLSKMSFGLGGTRGSGPRPPIP